MPGGRFGPARVLGARAGPKMWLDFGRPACDAYPPLFTSRLTTGQFTMNPLGPNELPAGNPVALPSVTCCSAVEKSVWTLGSGRQRQNPTADLRFPG